MPAPTTSARWPGYGHHLGQQRSEHGGRRQETAVAHQRRRDRRKRAGASRAEGIAPVRPCAIASVTAGSVTPCGRSWLSTIAVRAAAKSGIGLCTSLLLYACNTVGLQGSRRPYLYRSAAPTAIHRTTSGCCNGVDRSVNGAAKTAALPGPMAEWLRRGLQILARRFDSGSGLQPLSRCPVSNSDCSLSDTSGWRRAAAVPWRPKSSAFHSSISCKRHARRLPKSDAAGRGAR